MLSAREQTRLRRQGARYLKDKRKLTVPARALRADDDNMLTAVSLFLDELYNEGETRASKEE